MIKTVTSRLHLDVLTTGARNILGRLKRLTPRGVLGGGSAIALQIGHRRSYDLDVFLPTAVPRGLLRRARQLFGSASPLMDTSEELTCNIKDTKLTVLSYSYRPRHPVVQTPWIPLFDVRDLASNKAYAIGRRGFWRDYVDLFMLLRGGLTLQQIITEAEQRFDSSFNSKLFLEQLTYYGDVRDYSIHWMKKPHPQSTIKQFFQRQAREYLRTVSQAT